MKHKFADWSIGEYDWSWDVNRIREVSLDILETITKNDIGRRVDWYVKIDSVCENANNISQTKIQIQRILGSER